MRITQGTFSFLPDLTDEQIKKQSRILPDERLRREPGIHGRSASPQHLLGDVGHADVRRAGCSGRHVWN